jgi:hypothetical protein
MVNGSRSFEALVDTGMASLSANYLDHLLNSRVSPPAHKGLLMHGHIQVALKELSSVDIPPGSTVGIVLDNTPKCIGRLISFQINGLSPLLLSRDHSQQEIDRLLFSVSATEYWDIDGVFKYINDARSNYTDQPSTYAIHLGGVWIPSSGSTGPSKPVFRSYASLVDEGERYITTFSLSESDTLLLASPIYHAYAFGVLWAGIVSQSAIAVVPSGSLNAISVAIRETDACIFISALQARMLGIRGNRRLQVNTGSKAKFVMAGAGPIDRQALEKFQESYSIGLGRNYGSAETGAVIAGLPPLSHDQIGRPFNDVCVEIDSDGIAPGEVVVTTRSVSHHRMGDLAEYACGVISIVGRVSDAIRKGNRWISNDLLLSNVLSIDGVRDAYVRKASIDSVPGDDRISLELVVDPHFDISITHFREQLGTLVPPDHIPDIIHIRSGIPRSTQGKPIRSPLYRFGESKHILQTLLSHRVGEVLIALHKLNLADKLNEPVSARSLADCNNINLDAIESLLEILFSTGLLEKDPSETSESCINDIAYSASVGMKYSSALALSEILKSGAQHSAYTSLIAEDELRDTYNAAVHNCSARVRSSMVLRMVGKNRHIFEICGGESRYQQQSHRAEDAILSSVSIGLFRNPSLPTAASFSELVSAVPPACDTLILCNSVRTPWIASNLFWLVESLGDNGLIVIDDIFAESPSTAAFHIDWLSHGNYILPDLGALSRFLSERNLSFKIFDKYHFTNSPIIAVSNDISIFGSLER